MKIVTAAEMREIDRNTTQHFGVSSLTLMENAGTAVAEFVQSHYAAPKRVAVICGKGNNGGDGFVAARKLHEAGRNVSVILLAVPEDVHGDAAAMLAKLPIKPIIVQSAEELQSAAAQEVFRSDVLLDAILGTGFQPPVKGLYEQAIALLNAGTALSVIIAVDISSGADADLMQEQPGSVAKANAIVTFTAPRPAHIFGSLSSGPIVIAPIGSPPEAIISSLNLHLTTPADLAPLLVPRPRDSNKGMYGHVLMLGGSLGKSGAVAMAGMAALRAGAGLVTVATAKSALPTVAGFHPELMTEPLAETDEGSISLRDFENGRLDELAKNKTVFAIGPGISRHPETSQMVRGAVQKVGQKSQLPIVLDADGLNAFEGRTSELNGKNRTLVITPHPGEMARLAECSVAEVQRDRLKIARAFAREHEVIVVLKGDRTLIASPDGTAWVNPTGNPGMATGGTGDILTGIVAGFMAQHPTGIFEAVVAAVYLHGLAGDVACETMGERSLIATDLLPALPEAFRRVQRDADKGDKTEIM